MNRPEEPHNEAGLRLDIDHLVPLAEAFYSGGWRWSKAKKNEYYNYLSDPRHLIAITRSENRSKGSRGPDEWVPKNVSYLCDYAYSWARINTRWGLTVTDGELTALRRLLEPCEHEPG